MALLHLLQTCLAKKKEEEEEKTQLGRQKISSIFPRMSQTMGRWNKPLYSQTKIWIFFLKKNFASKNPFFHPKSGKNVFFTLSKGKIKQKIDFPRNEPNYGSLEQTLVFPNQNLIFFPEKKLLHQKTHFFAQNLEKTCFSPFLKGK